MDESTLKHSSGYARKLAYPDENQSLATRYSQDHVAEQHNYVARTTLYLYYQDDARLGCLAIAFTPNSIEIIFMADLPS